MLYTKSKLIDARKHKLFLLWSTEYFDSVLIVFCLRLANTVFAIFCLQLYTLSWFLYIASLCHHSKGSQK